MRFDFFYVFKLLFPKGEAFRLVVDSKLRKFIKGLSKLGDDVKNETEKVYLDLFPETTRAYSEWEKQFAVMFANEQYGDNRKNILESLWRINFGGQTLDYLTSVLKKISDDINVYENIPVRDPRKANSVYSCMCGQKWLVAGNKKARCGYRLGSEKFVPSVIRNNSESIYDIPYDVDYWENCFFIAKSIVRNNINEIIYCQELKLDKKWRNYVEYLILKIKPVHTDAVLFIEWV